MKKNISLLLFLALLSCSSFKEKTGLVKYQPDEYQVETNTSLVVPPDFNIRSPEEIIAGKSEKVSDDLSDFSPGESNIIKNMNQQ